MKIRKIYGPLDPEFIKGGQGSGNFGHAGRPGERGGSGEGQGDPTVRNIGGDPAKWTGTQKFHYLRSKFAESLQRQGKVEMSFANGARIAITRDDVGRLKATYTHQNGTLTKDFTAVPRTTPGSFEQNISDVAGWARDVHEIHSNVAPKTGPMPVRDKASASFAPAISVENALMQSKALGMKNIEMKTRGLSEEQKLKVLNNVNEAATKIANAGYKIPEDVVISKSEMTKAFGGRHAEIAPAALNTKGLTSEIVAGTAPSRMIINPANSYWADPAADAAKMHSVGYWSTDNPLHAFVHESGHYNHYKNNPSLFYALHGSRIGKHYFHKNWNPETAKKVSKYGATNPLEFVAETFAGIGLGKTYSADVMTMYQNLGGPIARPL